MLSRPHEAPLEVIHQEPDLLVSYLELVDVTTPHGVSVELVSERCTQMNPTEALADCVALLKDVSGRRIGVVIVEIQRKRDPEKTRTWPLYIGGIWRRFGLPVTLLVICTSQSTATWAARPLELGPVGALQPYVVAPSDLPAITDPDAFDGDVVKALLGAIMHCENKKKVKKMLKTLATDILPTTDAEQAGRYSSCLYNVVSPSARAIWEQLMSTGTHEYQELYRRMHEKGLAEGETRGEFRGRQIAESEAVLAVFAARGIAVSAEVAERISGTHDLDLLRIWLRRAVTADDATAIFD